MPNALPTVTRTTIANGKAYRYTDGDGNPITKRSATKYSHASVYAAGDGSTAIYLHSRADLAATGNNVANRSIPSLKRIPGVIEIADAETAPARQPKADKAPAGETARQRTTRMNAEAPAGKKWCPRHEQYHDRSAFASNKAAKDGLFSVCKAAEADDRRRWKAEKAANAKPTAPSRKPKAAAKPTPKATTRRTRSKPSAA